MTRTNRERITFFLVAGITASFAMLENRHSVLKTSILGRVVKAMDLSPIGQCPREFEPRRMQLLFSFFFWLSFVCDCVSVLGRKRDGGEKQKESIRAENRTRDLLRVRQT